MSFVNGQMSQSRAYTYFLQPLAPGAAEIGAHAVSLVRMEQEAAELFPGARLLVLSSDLVESLERLRSELDDIAGIGRLEFGPAGTRELQQLLDDFLAPLAFFLDDF